MKKLIAAAIGLFILGYIIPASAGTTDEAAAGNCAGKGEVGKRKCNPEQIAAKIDERIKKLEEHKTKATEAGRSDIVNAIQALEDALKKAKEAINSKDKEAFKAAMEQRKTAAEALKKLIPDDVKEKLKEKAKEKQGGKKLNDNPEEGL